MSAEHFNQYWADQEAAFTCCCGDDMDNHAWDETHSPTSYASHAQHLRAMELREVFGADPDSSNEDLVAAFFNQQGEQHGQANHQGDDHRGRT